MPDIKITKVTEPIPGGQTWYEFITPEIKKDFYGNDATWPSEPKRFTLETLNNQLERNAKEQIEIQAKIDLINQLGG